MSALEGIRKGLAAFLSREWETEVRVENVALTSAGARRLNVLFDAVRGDEKLALVATIIPNPAIQVMDIEVEASCLRFAEAAGMPVPHVHTVCSDASFVGGPFFIGTRVDGETIPRRVLRLVESTPHLGPTLARQSGEALARLHAAPAEEAHPGLGRPEDLEPAELGLRNVEAQLAGLLQPLPASTLAFRWLERNRPAAPDRLSVVHGDYRNGNIIVGPDGLRAALDWEVCHLGDPLEDLGWLCVRMWRFRNDALEVGGFAERADLRAGYEAAGGTWDEASFHWWKTYGTLRWGLGLAGQAAAHIDGSVPSIVMAASGRRVAELEYDTLMLLRGAFE
ncbi:MAG: phosphotransferase family protein [Myxococcota bacterium]